MPDPTGSSAGFSPTGVLDKPRRRVPSDVISVASLAVLAYAAANVLHEGLGHGGACLAVGGVPRLLTSVSFECDLAGASASGTRIVAAGGTVVNLLVGWMAGVAFGRVKDGVVARFFLWLLATVNLLQAFGYFLFSGVGRVGDWAAVMAPVEPAWAWRSGIAIAGFTLYYLTTKRAFLALGGFIGGPVSGRQPIAQRLALIAYFTGGGLYCVSGVLNPGGMLLLLFSAAAASFGGTSGLAWGSQLLRGLGGAGEGEPVRIPRDLRLVAAAGLTVFVFVFLLGPGIGFGGQR